MLRTKWNRRRSECPVIEGFGTACAAGRDPDSPISCATSVGVRVSLPSGNPASVPSTNFGQSQSGAAQDEPLGRPPPPAWWTLAKCPHRPQRAIAPMEPGLLPTMFAVSAFVAAR